LEQFFESQTWKKKDSKTHYLIQLLDLIGEKNLVSAYLYTFYGFCYFLNLLTNNAIAGKFKLINAG